MSDLTMLETILNAIKEHNITAYEIGKHTKISTFAIQKIIKGETKKPNPLTLNAIREFVEKAIEGSNYIEKGEETTIVSEPKKEYYKTNKRISLAEELHERILDLTDKLIAASNENDILKAKLKKYEDLDK